MNLIKIWQLEVAVLATCVKRFISSRVIRGSALVEMSGGFWLLFGSMRTEEKGLLSYPLSKNLLSSRCHESCFEKEN